MLFLYVFVSKSPKSVVTLEFLDQGSLNTLFHARLFESVEISGEKKNYDIRTVNQTSEQRNGQKAKLVISAVTSNEMIEVKNVYCVDKLPI